MATWTFIYHGNGATDTGGYTDPWSETKQTGETMEVYDNWYTKSGCTFLGWGTTTSAVSSDWPVGYSGAIQDSWNGQWGISNYTLHLYAIWERNYGTFIVKANFGGSTREEWSPAGYFSCWVDGKLVAENKTEYKLTGNIGGYAWNINTFASKGYEKGTAISSGGLSPAGIYISPNGMAVYTQYYSPKVYTVTFNANGGSGSVTSQTITYNTSYILNSGSDLTRSGYDFTGWTTNSDGTNDGYNWTNVTNGFGSSGTWTYDNGEYGISSNALTLYAMWTLKTYTVSYNANGGTGAPAAQTKTHGTTLTLSSTKPTRSSNYTNGYKVTFSGDGGTPNVSSITAQDYTAYTFKNWKATNGTTYSAGSSYTTNADTTMTAQWTTSSTKGSITLPGAARSSETVYRTVTFDANGGNTPSSTSLSSSGTQKYNFYKWHVSGSYIGGEGDSYTPTSSVTASAAWSLPSATYSSITLPTCTRTGYNFKGWSTSSTASSGYAAGTSYTPSGDETLYATWAKKTYTVSYDANGGTGAPAAQTKTYGTTLTLSQTEPTKANTTANGYTITFDKNGGNTPSKASATQVNTTVYEFQGWTATNGTPYTPGDSYTANASTIMTADWDSSVQTGSITTATCSRSNTGVSQTITFDVNGGNSLSKTSDNASATKSYSFSGWYDAASGGTRKAGGNAQVTPTATQTWYAHWSSSIGAYEKIDLPTGTKTDYILDGFSTSPSAITSEFPAGGTYQYNVDGTATTLYAVWKLAGWYIIYHGNSETSTTIEGIPETQRKEIGGTINLSTNIPTRKGHNFVGWATEPDGAVQYQPGESYTPEAHLDLYAIWEPYETKIYIYENGAIEASNFLVGNTAFDSNGIVYSPGFQNSSENKVKISSNMITAREFIYR